jgi:hypothetical protein
MRCISYAQALREVDGMRVDGSFVDTEGNKVSPIAMANSQLSPYNLDCRPRVNTCYYTS